MLKINLARNKTVIILGILSSAFILLFLKLSIWQFSRANEKIQIIEQFSQSTNDKTTFKTLNSTNADNIAEYTAVRLQGYFDENSSILLSNQYSEHRVGYHVLTPFIIKTISDDKLQAPIQAILVDRGWISQSEILQSINQATIQPNLFEISGLLRKSNTNQYIMGQNVSKISAKNTSALYQIQKINLTDEKLLGLFTYQLSNNYLQLLTPKDVGFDINWQLVNISPEKHKAYAIQWLLLAISVVLLYSYLCYKTYKANDLRLAID